jgi:hypothetical protein
MPAVPFEIGNKPLFFAGQILKGLVVRSALDLFFGCFPLTDISKYY